MWPYALTCAIHGMQPGGRPLQSCSSKRAPRRKLPGPCCLSRPAENRARATAGKRRLRVGLLAAGSSLFAGSGASAAADAPESYPAQIEAFVAAARATHPEEPLASYSVRTLGSSEAMFQRLLPLILDGSKTGTFSLGAAPQLGDVRVITHFDGTPALIWRVTAVEIVPFDAISTRHVQVEGEALRDVEAWRKVHLAAWATQLAGKSREEIGAMPVVAETYVVIYPQVSRVGGGNGDSQMVDSR